MIRYSCPKCGELLQVDDAKAGSHYVCSMCAAETRVPDDIIHQKRMRELGAIQKTRHLTADELTECAQHLRALGNEEQAAKAELSAAKQRERERHAAALEAAGVVAPTAPQIRRLPRASAPIIVGTVLLVGGLGLFFAGRSTAPTAPARPPIPQPANPQQYTVPPPSNTFQTRQEQPAISRGASPQTRQALDAAHDLQSAVKVGLNFEEYSRQLIEASQKVDRCKREVSTEEMRSKCWEYIDAAMTSYETAGSCWERLIKHGDSTYAGHSTSGLLQECWSTANDCLIRADAAIMPR